MWNGLRKFHSNSKHYHWNNIIAHSNNYFGIGIRNTDIYIVAKNIGMNKRISKRIEYIIHIIIWGAVFLLLLLEAKNLGIFRSDDGSIYIPLFYGLLSNLFLFYINANFLIPRYIPKKKASSYLIIVLIMFFVITLFESILDKFIFINLYSTDEEPFGAQIILNAVVNALILSLSIGYGFIKSWIINENQKKELEKEKLGVELNYLKAQINPHFLFNTLNMAYSSAIKHGDDETSDIIENLSSLLRYNLYECNDNKVSLDMELNNIKNYINLQTKRLPEDLKHFLKIHIDQISSQHEIAPLILMPFVENVFKHGIVLSTPGKIEISIKVSGKHLTLLTRNPIALNKTSTDFSGIGNKNVRTRLEILYKQKYSLKTNTENNTYFNQLNIEL